MKILFLHEGHLDVHNWSGTTLSLYNCLKVEGFDVENLSLNIPIRLKIIKKVIEKLGNHKGDIYRYPLFMKWRRKIIFQKLLTNKFDAIFSVGNIPVAALPTNINIPVYFYTDATINILKNYYPEYNCWDEYTLNIAEEHELIAAKVVEQTKGAVFVSSQWCANSFNNTYLLSSKRIHMVRIASNHMKTFSKDIMNKFILHRVKTIDQKLNLLFVGVAWNRKGGSDFLQLCRVLQKRGILFHAHIVGCQPKIPNELKSLVTVYGFLRKDNPNEQMILDELYQNAHFFILPTHAECTAVVFCESSAYGIPSLSYDTGGLRSVIDEQQNGKLFPLNLINNMEEWADWIQFMIKNKEEYEKICRSSYQFANKELTWKTVGMKMAKIIKK